jgi:hypothetical protein
MVPSEEREREKHEQKVHAHSEIITSQKELKGSVLLPTLTAGK